MAGLTLADWKDLDRELRRSFRGFAALKRFLRDELDPPQTLTDFASDALGAEDLMMAVLDQADGHDWLDDLVVAAAAARPRNTELQRLAAKARPPPGAPPVVADTARPFDLLDLSTFDLAEIEREFRDARRQRRGSRLIGAAVACRDERFMTSLRRRIETILGVGTPRPKIELDGVAWTAGGVFDQLAALTPTLEQMHVLFPISVGADKEVAELWDMAKARFTALPNDLVLMLFVRPGATLPPDIVVLPPPAAPSADIEIWVEQVGRQRGWTAASCEQLADEIIGAIGEGTADVRAYRLYSKLDQVTEQLKVEIAAARARPGAA